MRARPWNAGRDELGPLQMVGVTHLLQLIYAFHTWTCIEMFAGLAQELYVRATGTAILFLTLVHRAERDLRNSQLVSLQNPR